MLAVGAFLWQKRQAGIAARISFNDTEAVARTKQLGATIAAAIEQFEVDRGEYPRALSDLAPGYLAQVPPPEAGRTEWDYRLLADGGYSLVFGLELPLYDMLYPYYSWQNETETWNFDD
ncbi:MAG: hypothetical protein DRQ55_14405 [Planctomycetota bacterium]|nr:MAG: hypothetical protein DRQ55_14405 [Planctomycetota bacterium]